MPIDAADIKKKVQAGEDPSAVKQEYMSKGMLEADIEKAMKAAGARSAAKKPTAGANENAKALAAKDIFDTFGYAFSSQQFLNIFFYQSGAGLFLIGMFNAFRNLLTVLASAVVQSYNKNIAFYKKSVTVLGIFLSISMLLLACATGRGATWMFAVVFLLTGILVAGHGDFYIKVRELGEGEGNRAGEMTADVMGNTGIMVKVQRYGLVMTAFALIVAGYALDKVAYLPVMGWRLHSSFLLMSMAALSFFLGLLMFMLYRPDNRTKNLRNAQNDSLFASAQVTLGKTFLSLGNFMKDRTSLILIIATMLVSTAQMWGSIFYGLFIFNNLGEAGFGPYLNVAVIFTIAALTSLLGPIISRLNAAEYGTFPMLAFGTMLMAIMPFVYFFNPNIGSIAMATTLGIIGAAIAGVAQGMLVHDLIPAIQHNEFYSSIAIISSLPFVITGPLGGYIADRFGMSMLFLVSGIILIAVVGLYFLLVLDNHNKHHHKK